MKKILLLTLCTIIGVNAKNITVIGIGRLGLCTALCFEKAGYEVLGIDINEQYVNELNAKKFISHEPQVSELLQKSTHFRASCSLSEGLAFADLIYIMVDTPTTQAKYAYDHKNLNSVLTAINARKVCNKHIVVGCTVFPGYIDTLGKSLIKDCINTSLSYNPEFIAQGNIIYGLEHPDIVLIGEGSSHAGDALEEIYRKVCVNNPIICRMSPASAEITKLSINCFITTKIAFANMIGDIADKTSNANKHEILAAIGGDTRIGPLCLNPGYGFGGPCFPRDNRALGSYAEQVGIEPLIPQATDRANQLHARFMAEQLLQEHRELYYFENVTYKENCAVPIIEESQKLAVAAELVKRGKKVEIRDKECVLKEVKGTFGDIFKYTVREH